MQTKPRRKAYTKLLLLLSLILAWGGISCCSIKTSELPDKSDLRPHHSFLYIELLNVKKVCNNGLCYEALYSSAGSGFAIAPLGEDHTLGITAGHVCEIPEGDINKSITATSYGGDKHEVSVISIYGDTDTCVIAVHNTKIPPLPIAENPILPGDRVMALGAPLGIHDVNMVAMFDGYFSGPAGRISHAASSDGGLDLSGYTVPARPGSSGGPILNMKGEVVGMVSLAHPSFETFALSPRQEEFSLVLQAILRAATR